MINKQEYIDSVIFQYLEVKKVLMIIGDFNRHDKLRNTLLRSTTIEQLLVMDNFVQGLEENGIRDFLPVKN